MAIFVSVVQFCRSELFVCPSTFTAVTTAIMATPTAYEQPGDIGIISAR